MFNPVPHESLLLDGIDKTSGMEVEELAAICGLITEYQPNSILEIGTKHGRTAINMSKHSPDACKIFCVDIHHLVNKHTSSIAQTPYFRKLCFITADSLVYDFKSLGQKFDFILVDGNHMGKWVKNDTEKALSVLAPNGVIVWHDYDKAPKYTMIQVKATLDIMGIKPTHIPRTSLAYMVKS